MDAQAAFENKRKIVLEGLVEGLYGHILITKAYWTQLAQYLESYIPSFHQYGKLDSIMTEINDVFHHHPLARYPVSPRHFNEVVEWLKPTLERCQSGLKLNVDLAPDYEAKFIFKSLRRNAHESNSTVTLLEENDIIGHGTTGLTSWQGALFLTDWILSHAAASFEGRSVIEVGCGVGFLGLHLLKSIPIRSYNFTDSHPKVLNTVWFNLNLNFESDLNVEDLKKCTQEGLPERPSQDFPWEMAEKKLTVDKLDWTDVDTKTFTFQNQYDFILGADVVYERSLIPPLCRVLKLLFEKSPNIKAFIACTERSTTTLDCFESNLKEVELRFDVIAKGFYTPAESPFCSDVLHQKTRIYALTS